MRPMFSPPARRRLHRLGLASLLTLALGAGALACDKGSGASDDGRAGAPAGPEARPVKLRIASAGVDAVPVTELKPGRAGALPLPPAESESRAGWHSGSVAPGQPGVAVLAGRVHAGDGAGLSKNVARTRVGDKIVVERADGERVTFVIGRIQELSEPAPDPAVLKSSPGEKDKGKGKDRARELRVIALGPPPAKVIKDTEDTEDEESAEDGEKETKRTSHGLVLSATAAR
ncbi:class F sortase [Streptomyces sp. CAU 1734]|uniref:class F sortase n=1 Tax=Streptomyces sp. CAU 1734 TaxID=3140360 RepID=UPI003261C946